MLALLVANFGTTVAEFSGIAAAFSLAHIPAWLAVPPVAVAVWFLVTRGNYRKVERVFLALTAVCVTYFIAGFMARPDWGAALQGAVMPQAQLNSLWILTVDRRHRHDAHAVGPVLHPGDIVDKTRHLGAVRVHAARGLRGRGDDDRRIDFFIVLACAATLFPENIVVASAQDAATALQPFPGTPHATCSASACSACRSSPPASSPGHGVRRLRGLRLRERAGQLVPRGAGVQQHHHLPDVRAGGGGGHPRAAAGQGDPGRRSRSTASCSQSSSSSRCCSSTTPS